MFFNFSFRHYLFNPTELAQNFQSSSMRGYKLRLVIVLLVGLLLFSARNWWGLNTESLTSLVVTHTTLDYSLARIASLLGTIIWAVVFMVFHLVIFAVLLGLFTEQSMKNFLPIQLIVTFILLVEKGLIFFVFVLKGASVNLSFLSLGPIAATYIDIPFFVFFFNQLSLTVLLIIILQYKYGAQFMETKEQRKRYFLLLIVIHLILALIVAAIGEIPVALFFDELLGGGIHYD